MIKNILFFIFFVLTGIILIILFYKFAPAPVVTSLEILPKTYFSIDNAPKDSLKGEISSISGSLSYEPRYANAGFILNHPTQIQQGDQISTLGNGSAVIDFPTIGTIFLSSNCDINIIQTLPQNFVVEEGGGNAIFQRNGNIDFSVRALDLLINLGPDTKVSVTVDSVKSQILFTVETGEVTFDYTDTQDNSNVINVKPGKEIIFDNNSKTFDVLYK